MLTWRGVPAFAAAFLAMGALAQEPPLIEVWKSPTCGCCGQWVKHLRESGFAVRVNTVEDTSPMRRALGIPERLGSCHTARVAGYAIEGHVPATEIKRLLAEKDRAVGLVVPGMPMGAPGMEGPRSQAYNVLLMAPGGGTAVYRRY